MQAPIPHFREPERLAELEKLSILDTLPEEDFDNLTALAAQICGTPISLVSLLDPKRQWFKSRHGLDASETPREYAFCAHAINSSDEIFTVEDARTDERFHDNPLVTGDPNVIFYAGIPLKMESGLPMGTLCVIDNQPRKLTETQKQALATLSDQVTRLLELRKAHIELQRRNEELDRFAGMAAHDLKTPLNNISSLLSMLEYTCDLDRNARSIMDSLNASSEQLRHVVTGLLEYSRSYDLTKNKQLVDLNDFVNELTKMYGCSGDCVIRLKTDITAIETHRTLLQQIFMNLIANAVKYCDKDFAEIDITVKEKGEYYECRICDNGPGIPEEKREEVFELFKTGQTQDRNGEYGTGIGLAIVKRRVESLGGKLWVTEAPSGGAQFIFNFRKSA